METLDRTPEVLTPEQASEYLQVSRETVYRYIRDGKLIASRLGRVYRIPKRSLDLLLWGTRARQDITLRDYTDAQVAEFLRSDRLDDAARSITERFRQEAGSSRDG